MPGFDFSQPLTAEYISQRLMDPELASFEAAEKEHAETQSAWQMVETLGKTYAQDIGFGAQGSFSLAQNAFVGAWDLVANAGALAADVVELGDTAGEVINETLGEAPPPKVDINLRNIAPEFMGYMDSVRSGIGAGSGPLDVFTQKVFQFAVPFSLALKGLGGVSGASFAEAAVRTAGADAAATMAAVGPHEGRFVDLIQEFVDPDGMPAIVSGLVDALAADPDDTDWQARFKNVVDGQVANAAIGGLIMAGASAFRGARKLVRKAKQDG